jgi:hypothetical protein
LRDAATLWGAVRTQGGAEARDAVWAHPDLMPGPAELDDPLGFAQAEPPEQEVIDAEFDAALADLLEQPDDHSGSPESGSTTPDERSIPPDPDADGSDERPEGSR